MFGILVRIFGGVTLLVSFGAMAMAGEPHNDGIYSDPGSNSIAAQQNVGGEAAYLPPSEVLPMDPVPEPGTLVLVGSGLIMAARFARKRTT